MNTIFIRICLARYNLKSRNCTKRTSRVDEMLQRKIEQGFFFFSSRGRTFFILLRCYTFAFDALSRVYIKLNKNIH